MRNAIRRIDAWLRTCLVTGIGSFSATSVHLLVILGLAVAVYASVLHGPFQFDDHGAIVENRNLHNLKNLRRVLFSWIPPRPLVDLSFALNYHVGKLQTFGYHLVNLVFHLLSCLVVYGTLRYLVTYDRGSPAVTSEKLAFVPFIGALIFAVHPINTEAVSYIWGRSEVFYSVFYLLAFLFFIKSRENELRRDRDKYGERVKWIFYILSVLFFLMSLASKATAISFIAALLLFEILFVFQGKVTTVIKNVLKLHTIFILIVLGRLLGRGYPVWLYVFGRGSRAAMFEGGRRPLEQRVLSAILPRDPWEDRLDFFDNLINQLYVLVEYIRLLVVPNNLHPDHYVPVAHSPFALSIIASLAVIVAVFVVAVVAFRRSRLFTFGICWFFLTLAFYFAVPLPDLLVERRLYLPSVGFSICLALLMYWVVQQVRATWRGNLGRAVSLCLPLLYIGLLAIATVGRNVAWSDPQVLWTDAIRKSPQKARPYNNLATISMRNGEFDKALTLSKQALSLDPNSPVAQYNLLDLYLHLGLWEPAMEQFKETLRSNPPHAIMWARKRVSTLRRFAPHFASTLAEFASSLERNQRDAEAHIGLGYMYLLILRDRQRAVVHFDDGVRFRLRRFHRRILSRVVWRMKREAQDGGWRERVRRERGRRDRGARSGQ